MNVTEQPHAPATLPPGCELPIPFNGKLHGPQDLVWVFWTENMSFVPGFEPGIFQPCRCTDCIYFKYLYYGLVFHSFVQITRHSENHVYLAFSTP
jgi:hypothetical protein